jgi:hypothetical protein
MKKLLIELDRTPASADWLKVFDPVEMGLPKDTTPAQAAQLLHMDPDLPVFRRHRQADGTIIEVPPASKPEVPVTASETTPRRRAPRHTPKP